MILLFLKTRYLLCGASLQAKIRDNAGGWMRPCDVGLLTVSPSYRTF